GDILVAAPAGLWLAACDHRGVGVPWLHPHGIAATLAALECDRPEQLSVRPLSHERFSGSTGVRTRAGAWLAGGVEQWHRPRHAFPFALQRRLGRRRGLADAWLRERSGAIADPL